MSYRYSKFLNSLQILGDLLILNLAFLCAYYYKFEVLDIFSRPSYLELFAFYNISWLVLTALYQPYKISRTAILTKVLRRQLSLIVVHLLLITAFFVLMKAYYYSREQIILTYILFAGLDFLWKSFFFYSLQSYRSHGYNRRNIVILGYGELAEELKEYFHAHPEYGYSLSGVFDNRKTGSGILGKMDDLKEFVQNNQVDEIYCCLPYVRYTKVKELLDFADANIIKVKLIADFRGFSLKGVELERYDHIPVLNISAIPLDDFKNQIFKRTFDVVFSSAVLVAISPILLTIAIITRLTSKGPVFFSQERVGRNGSPFKIFKFRSMRVDAEKMGPSLSSDFDPRITTWGRFMRKTRLDELPQFVNVLIGDMSVVGPRPEREFFINQIIQTSPHYKRLLRIKPGITSLGQVKYGYASDVKEMLQRLRFDLLYIDNSSMWLDLRVMFLTALVMVQGRGK